MIRAVTSVQYRVFHLEPGAWSLGHESGVWSLESGVWSLESGAWSLESGVWSLEAVGAARMRGVRGVL